MNILLIICYFVTSNSNPFFRANNPQQANFFQFCIVTPKEYEIQFLTVHKANYKISHHWLRDENIFFHFDKRPQSTIWKITLHVQSMCLFSHNGISLRRKMQAWYRFNQLHRQLSCLQGIYHIWRCTFLHIFLPISMFGSRIKLCRDR